MKNLRLELTEDSLTLLDVVVPRGPGAIHALLRTITAQGWNIHAARLSTWAGLIRCALYLSEATPGTGGDLKAALSAGGG